MNPFDLWNNNFWRRYIESQWNFLQTEEDGKATYFHYYNKIIFFWNYKTSKYERNSHCHLWIIGTKSWPGRLNDWFINFNGTSTRLGLLYAKELRNSLHWIIIFTFLHSFYHLEYSNYWLPIHCYTQNILADMSFCFFQVFYVKLGSL